MNGLDEVAKNIKKLMEDGEPTEEAIKATIENGRWNFVGLPKDRRLKVATLQPYDLVSLRRGDRIECVESDMPEDASCVRIAYLEDYGELCCVIHSQTFDPVPSGQILPRMNPTVMKDLAPEHGRAFLKAAVMDLRRWCDGITDELVLIVKRLEEIAKG